MSQENFEAVLYAVRQLPLEQQRQLVEQLMKDLSRSQNTQTQEQAEIDVVEETRGSLKGLDRETIIWLAEDEELCGY